MGHPQPLESKDKIWNASASSDAVLTDAVRHVDIVHTSLTGMTAIVLLLLGALALPVLGRPPVTNMWAFAIMVGASFIGILGLYILNFHVHKHVTNQAGLTEVLVNSLGQGFVVFGADGICGKVYSQACLELLETVPAGQNIADVLRIQKENQENFKDWLDVLYQPGGHALGFEDIIRFFPETVPHSLGRRVLLEYKPLFDKNNKLTDIVLIATDVTEEHAAKQRAEKQQNYAEMICRIFQDQNQFRSTLAFARDFIDKTAHLSERTLKAPALLRELHTMKASLKQFNLVEFSEIVHQIENDLRAPSVETEKDFIEALILGRQKMLEAFEKVNEEVVELVGKESEWRGNVREILEDDIYAFARELRQNKADPQLIKHYIESIVAVPIRECFHSFERELRELASMMDKQVAPIAFEGENPKVLTKPLQPFFFSLTHMCRNIADHGIEPPVTRMAREKETAGQVTILAEMIPSRRGGEHKDLHIVIKDDGNGIDPARIREKLAIKDPNGDWRFEDDKKVIQRIFGFGFSTKEETTSLSGRGVGMEVVDLEVRKLGGEITVSSELYKGASFDILIPYDQLLAQEV
ncbi:MAG: ATP-binding protein [Bdellovibrionales bacterium]